VAEKKHLTIKEWEDFQEMVQGSKEDLEIVISNLRNLNVDLIYILLLVKSMRYNLQTYRIKREHRAAILAEFLDDLDSDTRFHVITDTDHSDYGLNAEVALPFKKLDNIINESYSDDHNVRTLFNKVISEHWSTLIPQNKDWDFLKNVEVKVET
jgi:hypothetical protein